MANSEVKERTKETIKSIKELLNAVKNSVHGELAKSPSVVNALDRSIEGTGKSLASTLKYIDRRTSREQLELLRTYKWFLARQADLIESRIRRIETLEPAHGASEEATPHTPA